LPSHPRLQATPAIPQAPVNLSSPCRHCVVFVVLVGADVTRMWSHGGEDSTQKNAVASRSFMVERVLLLTLLVPLVISSGFRVLLLFNRWFDPDEYIHMHYAWMVMKGYRPYLDFFENHPPGFWYLLAPLAGFFDESSAYLFACRVVMCLVTLAIFIMVYKLAAVGPGHAGPLFSIFLLSVEFIFLLKTLEVRPDQIVVLGWLLGAWFLIRPRDAVPFWAYGVSGACVGIGLLVSPKPLFAILSLGGALVMLRQMEGVRPPAWRDIVLFGLMSVTPMACTLLLMWFLDEGWPFLLVQYAFLYNFAYPERISGFKAIYEFVLDSPVFWVSTGIGSLLAIRRWRQGESEHERRRFVVLMISTVGAALAHFVLIPAPYPQSVLPLIAFLAILGAEWGRWLSDCIGAGNGCGRRRALAIGLVVVIALGSLHALASIVEKQRPLTRTNTEYIDWLKSLLRVTAQSDAILAGEPKYIFRPQASFYGFLAIGLLKEIRSGKIKYDIPERCAVRECPVIVLDRRLLEVGPWMKEFVQANYAPSSVKGVYLRREVGYRDKTAPGR